MPVDLNTLFSDMPSVAKSTPSAPPKPSVEEQNRNAAIAADARRDAAARSRALAFESQRGARVRAFHDDMGDPEAAKPAPKPAEKPATGKPDIAAKPGQPGETKSAAAAAPLDMDAPEGIDGKSPIFGEYRQLVGELGLDKEGAGKVLALYQRELQEQEAARERQLNGWRTELERDPEIMAGADEMRAFVLEHGGREFVEAIGDLGDNPAIVRGLVRMADAARRGGRR